MGDILFNLLASLLEMMMLCGVLCILRKDYLRKGRILFTAVVMAAAVVTADAFSIDMNTGLNVICTAIVLFLCFKKRFLDIFFDVVSGSMVCQMIQLIVLFICSSVSPSFLTRRVHILIALFLMTSAVYGVLEFVRLKSLRFYYHKYRRAIWVVLLNFYIIQAAYMYNWNETNAVEESVFILVLLVIATNVLLIYNIVVSKRQEELIAHQQQLFATKEEFVKHMAEKQHEFAKHLQMIHDLTENENCEAAVAQINQYTQELIEAKSENPIAFVYSGNSILSTFLMKKKQEAEEKGLQLSTIIKEPFPDIPCTQSELIEIAGNLLDNAMEAAADLAGEKRNLFFEIGVEKDNCFLQTINSLPENSAPDQAQMQNRGYSTKKGNLRGYGLPNIRSIAEKYQGKLEIRTNYEVILIKVLFP